MTLLAALWWLPSSALHCKIALPLQRTLTAAYITKCPLVFVPRCQHFVDCKPWLSSSHSHLPRPSVSHRLLVSPSSRGSAKASRVSTLDTWRMTEVVSAVRSIHCGGCRLAFRPARTWYTPFVSSLRRTSRYHRPRRPPWGPTLEGPTRVILPDSEEMGVRAACRPIMNAIRSLTNHATTIALCGVPGPRSMGKSPRSTSEWVHFYLRTSLYITSNPSLPPARCTCTPAQYTAYIEQLWLQGQLEPILLTSALLGNIRRRGLVTLLASKILDGVNLSCF